ncbi:ribonuclease H [Candidatus Riesia sp. GBBU]|nr:ribonuclease H [Candidatus Riesia sp. GBBU]
MKKKVEIFTDGSCIRNPGPGGYGTMLVYHKRKKILSGGYFLTTNNRMELMAAIVGLEKLRFSCEVILTTDSKYLYEGAKNWIKKWKLNKWKKNNQSDLSNVDLWKRLEKSLDFHSIHWRWVKSHSKCIENISCDKIAKKAASYPTKYDVVYYNFYSKIFRF